MNKLQRFMLKHPYISIAAIMPFALAFVLGLFSIILNIVLPILVSLFLAGWIYTAIVGRPMNQYYQNNHGKMNIQTLQMEDLQQGIPLEDIAHNHLYKPLLLDQELAYYHPKFQLLQIQHHQTQQMHLYHSS